MTYALCRWRYERLPVRDLAQRAEAGEVKIFEFRGAYVDASKLSKLARRWAPMMGLWITGYERDARRWGHEHFWYDGSNDIFHFYFFRIITYGLWNHCIFGYGRDIDGKFVKCEPRRATQTGAK